VFRRTTSRRFSLERLPQGDPKQRKPAITKARTLLGWESKVPLREGLAKSLDYFKECVAKEGKA